MSWEEAAKRRFERLLDAAAGRVHESLSRPDIDRTPRHSPYLRFGAEKRKRKRGAGVSDVVSTSERPIRLGVSSCLLGNEVRFDGGHKRDRFVTDLLGRFVEWVPVCPEVEVGMGTPRPALRLVGEGDSVRMVEIKSGRDHTRATRLDIVGRRVPDLFVDQISGRLEP